MNNCKNMGKKCEYADRLGMCENITATCARSRTMSRNLIDMDTLTEMIKRVCCHAEDETDLLDALKETPTVDAVEVVHCRDCKFKQKCPTKIFGEHSDDWFCADGERREK